MTVILHTLEGKQRQYPGQRGEIPCFRCGLCCIILQPKLDEIEVRHIALALGLSRSAFQKRYLNSYQPRPNLYLLKRLREACIFLRREGRRTRCLIHKVKPQACRRWAASLSCPECQEGLRRLGGSFLDPNQLYESAEERLALYQAVKDEQKETLGGP